MTKTILSVGAGYPQEEFADAIKARGYNLISIGKGKNSEHVISVSDVFAEVDTHSFEEVDKWISENNIHFDAAGSFAGGGAIITLQRINKKYGMPTQVPDDLMVGMDKFSQADLYEKYNLTSIKSWTVSELKEVPEDIDEFVVKPAVGRGSVGVEFVSRDELITKLSQHSIPDDYIIQVFRRGVEFRMLLIVQRGQIKLLAPVKRRSFRDTSFLGRLSCSTEELPRIEKYCEKMISDMNIENGIIKFDILVSNLHIDMIEMDISVGGGIYFKRYIEKLFEWDIINKYIDLILDEPLDEAHIANPNLVMDYVYNETGKPFVMDANKLEATLKSYIKGDIKVVYNKFEPWKTGKMGSNADFICTIIHDDANVTNEALNDLLNQQLFEKWAK
ncbi:hypothetical protein [Prevotella sp. E13-27]|uniref:hypothetical protein n=1 Tax=Prevotella sp. E13-27 TaxID=2938122 RepID=UPI00200A15DE|nr:hypothetical protein [Prevotella sp. E13-27]MCK8622333.1 hypothetical protein [Prevotella sp. E13-27]